MVEPIKTLTEWERVAFSSEPDFLDAFCHKANELLGVYWSADNMKVYYLLKSGQHVTDTHPMAAWMAFFQRRK